MAMRGRLMAYCKGFPGAREIRQQLTKVECLAHVEDIAAASLQSAQLQEEQHAPAP